MNASSARPDKAGQDTAQDAALDALLSHAPRYAPPAGFAERVLAALHEEEAPAVPLTRPWYLRPYTWAGTAVAACLTASLCLLPLLEQASPLPDATLAVDDDLLVDEVLSAIDDPDLISAICSVSAGSYSISTGSGVQRP